MKVRKVDQTFPRLSSDLTFLRMERGGRECLYKNRDTLPPSLLHCGGDFLLTAQAIAKKPGPAGVNEVGKMYGFLTVVGPAEKPKKAGGLHWTVQCVCGETSVVKGVNLRAGRNTSCGCKGDGKRHLMERLEQFEPPCDRGCSWKSHCDRQKLACRLFVKWIGSGLICDPDPGKYPPTHQQYLEIYGQLKTKR